ncbi:MAG: 50S ribosomal protein L6 [Ruminococcaceae bacterium]|nr:50S ribosomal protein L6 [Oscillospiraceae bacterium]
MSRIGRMPITVPAGVDFKLDEATNTVSVKGPKGTLTQQMHPSMKISIDGNTVLVERPDDNKENRSLHGLTRTLVNNMVVGVSTGFKKELEVNGVGYRVQMQGNQLVMNLGFSHQVVYGPIEGVTIETPQPNKIVVSGCDKQIVGQAAAEIREKRPPEPYKGKGIKYVTETIRRKEGKAGKAKK